MGGASNRAAGGTESPGVSTDYLLWFVVSLTALAGMTHIMSSFYTPKILWAAASLGLALIFLAPPNQAAKGLTPLGVIWTAFAGWAAFSLTWALSPYAGFERVVVLLLLTAAYLIAQRTRFWTHDAFWRLFCGLSIVISLAGCLQYLLHDHPLIRWIPTAATPSSTMGQRNIAATYLIVTLPFIAWHYFKAPPRAAWLPLCALFIGMLFLLFTRCRGAWLGAVLGASFAFWHSGAPQTNALKKKFALLLAPALLAILIGSIIPPSAAFINSSKRTALDAVESSVAMMEHTRLPGWIRGMRTERKLFLGCGLGNYPVAASPLLAEGKALALDADLHNDFVQSFIELGVPGLLLYLAIYIALLWMIARRRGNGLLAASGAAITGFIVAQNFMYMSQDISSGVWIAGVAALIVVEAEAKPLLKRTIPIGALKIGRLVATVLLFLLAVMACLSIRGDRRFRYESFQNQPDMAYLARKIWPTMWIDCTMLHINAHIFANIANDLGDAEATEFWAEQALALHPRDSASIALLADAQERQGEIDKAIATLEKAMDAFHYHPYLKITNQLERLYKERNETENLARLKSKIQESRVGVPQNPTPANRANDVPLDIRLDWSGCNAADHYELYLWKTGELKPVWPLARPRESRFDQEVPLESGTIYFWQVTAVGKLRRENSEVWYFKTERR
ncbi:O-antigen ligase family protein [Candidatus Sumerlaeota bacterium]|nr:O-antigen ligase family protein [Candidatus Sumerlaeota bacterium]